MSPDVQDLCQRRVDDVPAGLVQALAQVDVLEEHEVGRVEPSYLLERLSAHEKARARQPAGRSFRGLTGLLAVCPGPGVGRPEPSKESVADATPE